MSANRLIAGDRTSVSCHLFISIMHLSSGKVSDVTLVSSQALQQGAARLREDEIKRQRERLLGRECDADHITTELLLDPAASLAGNYSLCLWKSKKRYLHSQIATFIASLMDHFILHVAANYWEFWRSLCCYNGCIISSEMRSYVASCLVCAAYCSRIQIIVSLSDVRENLMLGLYLISGVGKWRGGTKSIWIEER